MSSQDGGDGGSLSWHADSGSGLADRRQPGADRKFSGDEVGAACRATRFGVVVGEDRALGRKLVDVGRATGHQTAVVGTDVPHADVIAHDQDNVRLILSVGSSGRQRGQHGNRECGQPCASQKSHLFAPHLDVLVM